ncbi:hypothetical protein ACQP3J_33940, partial [Escherichia coli]
RVRLRKPKVPENACFSSGQYQKERQEGKTKPLYHLLKEEKNGVGAGILWYLSHCSLAVKRNHDHGNSYKRKFLNGGLLTVS